jgi:quercetin dioxygenase-like cupin family protein
MGERLMTDTTVKKVSAAHSPKGEMGQTYLASGKRLSMRLWRTGPQDSDKAPSRREYETVGYVLEGSAELQLEGQSIRLEPGDSWLVPPDAEHRYVALEPFVAIEATAPPAQVHGRDQPPGQRSKS